MEIKKKKNRFEEIPNASMSDIAFLLIIFFMVSTVFVLKEGLITILPKPQNKPVVLPKNKILKVELDKKGQIMVDGQDCPRKRFEKRVKEIISRQSKMVVVRIDPYCKYEHAVWTVGKIQGLGVDRMSIKRKKE